MFIVQSYCTGLGWVPTRHSGNTLAEAQAKQAELMLTDSAWMPGKRETRIVTSDGVIGQHWIKRD